MDEIDGLGQLTDYRRLCSDLTLQTKKEGFFKVIEIISKCVEDFLRRRTRPLDTFRHGLQSK